MKVPPLCKGRELVILLKDERRGRYLRKDNSKSVTGCAVAYVPHSLHQHRVGQRLTECSDEGDHDSDWLFHPAQSDLFQLQEASCLQS